MTDCMDAVEHWYGNSLNFLVISVLSLCSLLLSVISTRDISPQKPLPWIVFLIVILFLSTWTYCRITITSAGSSRAPGPGVRQVLAWKTIENHHQWGAIMHEEADQRWLKENPLATRFLPQLAEKKTKPKKQGSGTLIRKDSLYYSSVQSDQTKH